MTAEGKRLVIVYGPTASGKTGLSVELGQALGAEIVSADSRQVYSELRIGVARPSETELTAVKHHFIATHSILSPVTAGQYAEEALRLMEERFRHVDTLILTGGTGLYIKAVLEGLDPIPSDPQVRKLLMGLYGEQGLGVLREELQRRDPEYFSQVDSENPHRVIRALEVIRITGKPYSSFRSGAKRSLPYRLVPIGLQLDRAELHSRIEGRVDSMVALGLEEEARSLYPLRHLQALNTVGYKEWWPYLEGRTGLDEVIRQVKSHTRQYARRQITWLGRVPGIHWIPAGPSAAGDALQHISAAAQFRGQ